MACILFSFGVSGEFNFDDFANLPPLFESLKTEGIILAVLGGESGPLGRPISLLAFALQSSSWPDAPHHFKWVNILIHAINTVLACIFVDKFAKRFAVSRVLLLMVVLLWSCIPIQVSTVLYVVQRMTLLSSMFTLLTLLTLQSSWEAFLAGKVKRGLIGFWALAPVCALLGLFSKESAVVVVFYAACLGWMYSRLPNMPKIGIYHSYITWFGVSLFLALGTIIFVYYFLPGFESRPFSAVERLMTESRILWGYIRQIVMPVPSQLGLYHDGFVISKGLLSPWSTLISITAWLVLVVVVARYRIKAPLVFFGVCWFLGGHVLESTLVPLELYFEHRNYLPSLGVLIACVGCWQLIKSSQKIIVASAVGLGCYFALIASITVQQAKLWGDPLQFMLVHAAERRSSIRARALEIEYWGRKNNLPQAYASMQALERDFPNSPSVKLLKLEFLCVIGEREQALELLRFPFDTVAYSTGVLHGLDDLIARWGNGECDVLNVDDMLNIVDRFLQNESYSGRVGALSQHKARILIFSGKSDEAMAYLEGLVEQKLTYDNGMALSVFYMERGRYEDANKLLLALEEALSGKERLKLERVAQFRNKISQDLEKGASSRD